MYAKMIGQFAGLAKRSQQAEWLSDRKKKSTLSSALVAALEVDELCRVTHRNL